MCVSTRKKGCKCEEFQLNAMGVSPWCGSKQTAVKIKVVPPVDLDGSGCFGP